MGADHHVGRGVGRPGWPHSGDSRPSPEPASFWLRATTPAMVEDVAAFVKHFAEQAPEPGGQISEGAHLGAFEPTSAPAVKQQKMTVTDHTRRILVTLLGVAFIVGAIVIIPLPGPFSFVVTIAGLAILALFKTTGPGMRSIGQSFVTNKLRGRSRRDASRRERGRQVHAACSRGSAGALAHDDVPVGAIVVADGDVIASARNERQLRQDPTAHAEVLGLRAAAEAVGSWRLVGRDRLRHVGAMPHVRRSAGSCAWRGWSTAPRTTGRGPLTPLYNIVQDPRLNHTMQVTPGVLAGGLPGAANVLPDPPTLTPAPVPILGGRTAWWGTEAAITGSPRKRVWVQAHRGFKSHPHRHRRFEGLCRHITRETVHKTADRAPATLLARPPLVGRVKGPERSLSSRAETCVSGRNGTTGNRVIREDPRVQIPSSPPPVIWPRPR